MQKTGLHATKLTTQKHLLKLIVNVHTCPTLTPARHTGTQFTYPRRMKGDVGLTTKLLVVIAMAQIMQVT